MRHISDNEIANLSVVNCVLIIILILSAIPLDNNLIKC
jgi:hypothetical protein